VDITFDVEIIPPVEEITPLVVGIYPVLYVGYVTPEL
jgi:hypothetical protein